MSADNKLTFDPPTHLPELTLNLIRSSRGHSTPFLKILFKSVQPFYRNLADKETNREINKLWCESTTNPTPCCDVPKFITFSVARWQHRTARRADCW